MNVKKLLLLCVAIFYGATAQQEFLYPVDSYIKDNCERALLLYQKSTNHIELWQWDHSTKLAQKALLSSYNPVGVRILPDKSGFSFIDEGRIRIKKFDKRSPRSIDIFQPLHNIGVVEWFDNHHGYFTACKNNGYAIFHVTLCGLVEEIFGASESDCIYPQKMDEHLFYIDRTHDAKPTYTIMRMRYPIIDHAQCQFWSDDALDFQESDQENILLHDKNIPAMVMDFSTKPIAFLRMISADFGFVIHHPSSIERQDPVIPFSCSILKKQDDGWMTRELFSFSILTQLLVPMQPADIQEKQTYLCESFLPLIPFYKNESFYFVDCKNSLFNIFCYSLETGDIKQMTFNEDITKACLVPRCIDNTLIFGGSLENLENENNETLGQGLGLHFPFMMLDKEGKTSIEMPKIEK